MANISDAVMDKFIATCFKVAAALMGVHLAMIGVRLMKLDADQSLICVMAILSATGIYCCLSLWSFYKVVASDRPANSLNLTEAEQ